MSMYIVYANYNNVIMQCYLMNIFDHLVLILSVILLVCVQVVTVVVYFCYMIDLQANALNSVTKVASS